MIKIFRSFFTGLARAIFLMLLITQINAKPNFPEKNITSGKPSHEIPDILLAQIYQRGIDVKQYLVSEKYDGVRAVWNGSALYTRKGRLIAAPA